MKNFRIVGAHKHDGSAIDEPIVALSAEEAVLRANRLGILVSLVEPIAPRQVRLSKASRRVLAKRRARQGGRSFIRAVAILSGWTFVGGGVLTTAVAVAILLISLTLSISGSGPAVVLGASALLWIPGSLLITAIGAALSILVYIESHLFLLAGSR